MEEEARRHSADTDLAVLAEWREGVDRLLHQIHTQTSQTNGRVSELEIKERIRQDREEQKAIRDAATEAAKYRVEQHNEEQATRAARHRANRITWRMMLLASLAGAVCSGLVYVAVEAITGHLG